MRSPAVVERDELAEAGLDVGDRVVGLEIHLLILDGSPEAFDKDVVPPAAFAIHADLDAMFLEGAGEFDAGELAALVGVEDFRLAVTQDGLLQGFDAEVGGQRIREEPPGKNPSAVPINDSHQIHKAPAHRDVGNIRGPHLIGPLDTQVAQQVVVNRMRGMPAAGVWLAVQRFDTHLPHQPANTPTSDCPAFMA